VTAGRVRIAEFAFDALSTDEVAARMLASLSKGVGGRVITPNVDILRRATKDPVAGRLLAEADLVVADGMPLVWAARLAGTPLPERVAGSSLVHLLIAGAARAGIPVVLIGAGPGVAERAAAAQKQIHPGLSIDWQFPPFGFDQDSDEMERISELVGHHDPCLALCGVGFPRQDELGAWLYRRHPGSWFVGCGASISFLAGEVQRAPDLLQNLGLEWVHRLALEPRRLGRRYAADIPFALRLLASSARGRPRRRE
jgi:N-acetylglucosaminyldiphosphoundecaprenol N-acetyl-beta-D-mannosaminyltransferase